MFDALIVFLGILIRSMYLYLRQANPDVTHISLRALRTFLLL